MIDTPVALFIFRRPDLTKRVFDAISMARPKQLLIVCDGPRREVAEDEQLVMQTREVVEKVDWPCDVQRRYATSNRGCGRCISEGLNWVFENVEEAIILEDDCLPDPSFFRFCSELLSFHRDSENVMAISGTNYFPDQRFTDDSYFFSKHFLCWGWATWRRAWKHYDRSMKDYPAFRKHTLPEICDSRAELRFHRKNLDKVATARIDTWDYQCAYSFWRQNGLCIHPAVNLISNIGFRADGTHSGPDADASAWNAELPTHDIGKIQHPLTIVRSKEADRYMTQHALLSPPKRSRSFTEHLRRAGMRMAKQLSSSNPFLKRAA